MWRPFILAGTVALGGCSSELPAPGPGFPDEVRAVRLFDGAGVDRTGHVFLFRNDTVHLEVRLYAADGHHLLEIRDGVEMTMTFTPAGIAVATRREFEEMIRAVTTDASSGTQGSLHVTLRFASDGSVKTFGPFECMVH